MHYKIFFLFMLPASLQLIAMEKQTTNLCETAPSLKELCARSILWEPEQDLLLASKLPAELGDYLATFVKAHIGFRFAQFHPTRLLYQLRSATWNPTESTLLLVNCNSFALTVHTLHDTTEEAQVLDGHTNVPNSAFWCPDGKHALSSQGHSLIAWDLTDEKKASYIKHTNTEVAESIIWNNDGTQALLNWA